MIRRLKVEGDSKVNISILQGQLNDLKFLGEFQPLLIILIKLFIALSSSAHFERAICKLTSWLTLLLITITPVFFFFCQCYSDGGETDPPQSKNIMNQLLSARTQLTSGSRTNY